ncbi:MAG: hypothetical protein WBW33_22265 [Bryobacteraceae bacterium]
MNTEFDAQTFTTRLKLGEYDGNLFEEPRKLSALQLEQVADILKDETISRNRLDEMRR